MIMLENKLLGRYVIFVPSNSNLLIFRPHMTSLRIAVNRGNSMFPQQLSLVCPAASVHLQGVMSSVSGHCVATKGRNSTAIRIKNPILVTWKGKCYFRFERQNITINQRSCWKTRGQYTNKKKISQLLNIIF